MDGIFIRETEQGVNVLLDRAQNFLKLITFIGKVQIGPLRIIATSATEAVLILGSMSIDIAPKALELSIGSVLSVKAIKGEGLRILLGGPTTLTGSNLTFGMNVLETTLGELKADIQSKMEVSASSLIVKIPEVLFEGVGSLLVKGASIEAAVQEFVVKSKTVKLVGSDGVAINSVLKPITGTSPNGIALVANVKEGAPAPGSIVVDAPVLVDIKGAHINVGGMANPALLGSETSQLLTQLLTALVTFASAMAGASVGVLAPLAAPATALNAQIIAIQPKLPTIVSKKVTLG